MKNPLRVYIDTSVIGGCLDKEFSKSSKAFFRAVAEGRFKVVVSELTLLELVDAPVGVHEILDNVPGRQLEHVELDEESAALAQLYVSEEVLSRQNIADAQHIAVATVCHVDLIVSWNFKHIVNFKRIRAFNAVNMKHGYNPVDIRSPLEVVMDE